MNLKRILAATLLLLPVSGFSWSSPQHQAIATAAVAMLPAPAKAKVEAILAGESPTAAATWLDDVREGKISAKQFNKDFSGHKTWHFVDYPIGSSSYSMTSKFSSP